MIKHKIVEIINCLSTHGLTIICMQGIFKIYNVGLQIRKSYLRLTEFCFINVMKQEVFLKLINMHNFKIPFELRVNHVKQI